MTKIAKSLRYNSDAPVAPKHAGHLPGVIETFNMESTGPEPLGYIITQTFGLFDCRARQRMTNEAISTLLWRHFFRLPAS